MRARLIESLGLKNQGLFFLEQDRLPELAAEDLELADVHGDVRREDVHHVADGGTHFAHSFWGGLGEVGGGQGVGPGGGLVAGFFQQGHQVGLGA